MILYHYCSTDSFLKIIQSSEIWACETSLSNDTMEGRWVRSLALEYEGASQLDLQQREQYSRQFDLLVKTSGALAVCFSTYGDMLSQWRGYAADGTGVSIGFSEDYLSKLKFHNSGVEFPWTLGKVEYDKAKQNEIVHPIFQRIVEKVKEGVFRYQFPDLLVPRPSEEEIKKSEHAKRMAVLEVLSLLKWVSLFKNPAFKEEDEWRLVRSIIRTDKYLNYSDRKFYAKADRIIPYEPISLRTPEGSALVEVILGPKNITPQHIVEAALESFGFEGIPVRRSEASYR